MSRTSRSKSMKRLARRVLDDTGSQWRQISRRLRLAPVGGWLAAIREAVGMPQAELGRRMNVGASTVAKLEKSERTRSIQISTLHRAAEALDCDLVYALVPRRSLQSMVDDQRLRLFAEIVARTDLHICLEGQDARGPDGQRHLLRQAEELIPDSQLWRVRPAGSAKATK